MKTTTKDCTGERQHLNDERESNFLLHMNSVATQELCFASKSKTVDNRLKNLAWIGESDPTKEWQRLIMNERNGAHR